MHLDRFSRRKDKESLKMVKASTIVGDCQQAYKPQVAPAGLNYKCKCKYESVAASEVPHDLLEVSQSVSAIAAK